MTATLGCLARPATRRLTSSADTAPPQGLLGLLRMMRLVLGVIWASTSSAVKANSFSSRSAIGTGLAPVYWIIER